MMPHNISQLPKSLQPTQQSSPSPIPSEDSLRVLLANNLRDVVQTQIDTYKLPYIITPDGKLTDALKGSDLWLKKFITVDDDTLRMKSEVPKLAKCPDEVLIHGETGTGKETIARAMIGERIGKFVAINCGGMPSELLESELFGHKKGSFTGADSTKPGMLSVAKDGVVFLDEIGELPLQMQAKLLRVIQEKVVRKVGENTEEEINCKFVFATNKNIPEMVKLGLFRQDLYARISTFEMTIKPIRERPCDIIPIIESMQKGKEFMKYCSEHHIRVERDLDLQHNVRSLHQYVRRFAVLGTVVTLSK